MKYDKEAKRAWKSATVRVVICFIVVIAIAGSMVFRRDRRENEQESLQENEQVATQETTSQAVENEETEEPEEVAEPKQDVLVETNSETKPLAFSPENFILWPVDGNVILNYSMDQTVYFATLDQYKYNPAILISGELDAEVMAIERGIISSVEEDAKTGMTVTVEMGNGFEAIYGQLKNVRVKEGDYVKQGQIIGYLAEPTKYYSVEGCNLYLQMLKDGEPVNPLDYLDV